jgi:archaellum component FlaF (FlaF/FlaG flagellin family)
MRGASAPLILLSILAFIVLLVAFTPLLVFVDEASRNPDLLSIRYKYYPENSTLTINITYSGTVPLKDFKIKIDNKTVSFGDLYTNSTVCRSLRITKPPSSVTLEFSVMGLYPVKVRTHG